MTDFQRNAKSFLSELNGTRVPIILTVNGKAALVIQDPPTYQDMLSGFQTLEKHIDDLMEAGDDDTAILEAAKKIRAAFK
ncbi:type II toxin-antitoxin system Phd/YefM family antitoxin [Geitlerinema splendidum]|nr:type II toxin-antitoxin system Phd/YefM family antitoxin [Geitlerinema splendidum]